MGRGGEIWMKNGESRVSLRSGIKIRETGNQKLRNIKKCQQKRTSINRALFCGEQSMLPSSKKQCFPARERMTDFSVIHIKVSLASVSAVAYCRKPCPKA